MAAGSIPMLPLITLDRVQWTRYIQVASLTLVIHDHLLTLPEEIDFVWRGVHSRSWPRLLFFAARYSCPIALIFNTFAILNMDKSDELRVYYLNSSFSKLKIYNLLVVCQVWLFIHGWSGYIFFGGVQVISQMRLWAMYRSRRVLIIMTVFAVLSLVCMGLIEGLGYARVKATSHPLGKALHICGPSPGHLPPKFVWTFWLPPILAESVAIVLVTHKAILYFQQDAPKEWLGSRLTVSIVEHSVAYFVVVLGVYIANLVIWLRLPVSAWEIVIPLTYALPSVAGNRMLLSLRSIFYSKHSLLPGQDDAISLTIVDTNRGLTIHRHNPLKEFDSFFGERTRSDTHI